MACPESNVAMATPEIEQRIQQALKALRAGRKEEARSILLSVVDEQEDNERAWLYLSAAVETLEEQQICLENVLAINPANEKARQGLERVNNALAARRSASPPPFVTTDLPSPPSSRARGPFVEDASVEQGASGAWYATGPFVEEPSLPPEPDPFAPATSVDWVRDDGPAVFGSGRQVELPSEQEYDEWLRSLNLRSPAAAAGEELAAETPASTGGTPPFAGVPSPPGSRFTQDEDVPHERSLLARAETSAARSPSLEESLRGSISFESEEGEAQADEPSWSPFWRETPDEVIEPSAEAAEAFAFSGASAAEDMQKSSSSVPDASSYYALIPDDIEEDSSGWRAVGYLVGIAILIALNVLSFGYLLR